jgi:hypothetical protein
VLFPEPESPVRMRMEKGDRWRWFDSGCGPGSCTIFVVLSELRELNGCH